MKHMKTIRKALLLSLALLLLVGTLCSCAGKEMLDSNWRVSDGEGCVTYFARILPQSAEAKERFIAASRGYNMSAEGFDDSKVEIGVVKPVDLEAAKAALEMVKPEEDTAYLKYAELRDAMTDKDVE